MKDEDEIRQLVAKSHRATAAGDLETILGLMAEDVVFLRAGQTPVRGKARRSRRGHAPRSRSSASSRPATCRRCARPATSPIAGPSCA